jgi:hypothetical protein
LKRLCARYMRDLWGKAMETPDFFVDNMNAGKSGMPFFSPKESLAKVGGKKE